MRRILVLTLAALLQVHGLLAPATDDVRAKARELLRTVIAFRTAKDLGEVPRMADYLAGKFSEAGFAREDIHVLPLKDTASLVVRYPGSGKAGKPILVMAHMDVVVARPEDWKHDPFNLIEEKGNFYGRGTADIKADLVAITMAFLRLKAERFVPARDLVIVFSGDEETGMLTIRDVVTNHRNLIDAEFALNGDGGGGVLDEGTGKGKVYYIQGAEKSYATFELTTSNPGGHSSQPRSDNAIYELADALKAVQGYQFPVRWNDWTIGSLRATAAVTPGELGKAMARFAADPSDSQAAAVISESPANIGRIRTTCVPTRLAGGHADNALPQSATATINCRVFPGTSIEDVRATLEKLAGPKAQVKMLGNPHTSPSSPMRDDIMRAVAHSVGLNYPGVPIVPDMAPYATDGSIVRAAGIPTYGTSGIFLKESEDFSHGLDERIPVASFYAALDHWYVLLKEIAGKD